MDTGIKSVIEEGSKMVNQAALAGIARSHGSVSVRIAAVHRITDEAVLVEIAKTDKSGHVMAAAVRRLKVLRGGTGQKNN